MTCPYVSIDYRHNRCSKYKGYNGDVGRKRTVGNGQRDTQTYRQTDTQSHRQTDRYSYRVRKVRPSCRDSINRSRYTDNETGAKIRKCMEVRER